MAKKLYIKTHGCQMNEYDSARMADLLKTGETVEIPERKVVRFKVSDVFKDELNGEREFDGF